MYNIVELFIFKYLTDLEVLTDHNNFFSVKRIIKEEGAKIGLKHYANASRKEIIELFPKSSIDGTTIINGTIFVNEKGEPNISNDSLFENVINIFSDYGKKYGSFKNIDRQFKTRLYETFLRQDAGIKTLGQYFTPRNVVSAIVKMSKARHLNQGARICDPFCGVGGFLLETLINSDNILSEYTPKNGKVDPKIKLIGYDKGSNEKEEERTIILAKANMLIYLSNQIAAHKSKENLKEFCEKAFNQTFQLIKSNLGTFEKVNEEKFDLILTNPPYVSSGDKNFRSEIEKKGYGEYYTVPSTGREGLALEWIIRNLKPNGQSIVIVPDGLMRQTRLMKWVFKKCIVEGVIRLPTRTFYATPQITFVLILSKKENENKRQRTPVFNFLITEIGETRDAKRLQTIENSPVPNDLIECATLFKQFSAAPTKFTQANSKLKVISFQDFEAMPNWHIDRLWTMEEKEELKMESRKWGIDVNELNTCIQELQEIIEEMKPFMVKDETSFIEIGLSDERYFSFYNNYTNLTEKGYSRINSGNSEDIPLYTASQNPVAYLSQEEIDRIGATDKIHIANDFNPIISVASGGDGCAGTNIFIHKTPFLIDSGRLAIRLNHDRLLINYVAYQIQDMKDIYGFKRSFGFNRKTVQEANVLIKVPIKADGTFDIENQKRLSEDFIEFVKIKDRIVNTASPLMKMRSIKNV